MLPNVVVVSPHLDDAVFSAWHVLSAHPAGDVVTVFAGLPEPGLLTDLDRAHGASESASRMRRRRADDEAALVGTGWRPVHLDRLEGQVTAYRVPHLRDAIAADPGRFLEVVVDDPAVASDPGELADLVCEHIPPRALVYGPAGIGRHPDHRDVARAMLLVREHAAEVRLYADSPYYLFQGPPSWLSGTPNPEADRWVDRALADLDVRADRLTRHVVHLDEAALAAKLQAMRRYVTEFPSVQADILARSGDGLEVMGHEAFWTIA